MANALILDGTRSGTGQATVKALLHSGHSITATVAPDVTSSRTG